MTRTQFAKLQIGTPVTVYAFGVHAGVVMAIAPEVTIQQRTFRDPSWIKVRIPGKPDYNGTFKDVDVMSQIARRRVGA